MKLQLTEIVFRYFPCIREYLYKRAVNLVVVVVFVHPQPKIEFADLRNI